jgi:pentatricopeptide repeat protein
MEAALALAPNAAEILIFYAALAASFGEPERGGELADKARRLDPDFPMWAARPFAHAYFMAGRFEEALAMLERLSEETYAPSHWAIRAGALAALGRAEAARLTVDRALAAVPGLSVASVVAEPWLSDEARRLLADAMLDAGFPDCRPAHLSAGCSDANLAAR